MSLYNFHLWTFNGNFRTNVCMCIYLIYIYKLKKIKCSRYRPGVSQRVGRGIALLLHDHGTRSRWVVSSTPRPHFTPGKVPVPILQEAGWALGPVWTSGNSPLRQNSIAARPARSQSLYPLSYPAHIREIRPWWNYVSLFYTSNTPVHFIQDIFPSCKFQGFANRVHIKDLKHLWTLLRHLRKVKVT